MSGALARARASLAGQRILITGASGLLGQAVREILHPQVPPPGCLARTPPPAGDRGLPIAADLAEPDAVERAVHAYAPHVILHLAAAVGDRLEPGLARRTNVEAPLLLQNIAGAAGARLVVASTVLVLGLDDLVDADEATSITRDPMIPYVETKVQMEQSLDPARTTILRFPRIYGAGDRMILPQMLKLLRAGRMVFVDAGERLQSFVHVDDAAAACVLAMGAAHGGGVYHITGGDRVTNREILDLIADAAELPRVTRSVPRWLALGLAGAYETLGLPPSDRLSRFRVKYLGCHHHYSIEKARRELGYSPAMRLAEALPEVTRAIHRARPEAAVGD